MAGLFNTSRLSKLKYSRNAILSVSIIIGVFVIIGAVILGLTVEHDSDTTSRTSNMATTLSNDNGVQVEVITTGAAIKRLLVPDSEGKVQDIVLGFDSDEDYKDENSPYFGTIVGRVANRIANAQFTLDGKIYKLNANNGPNTLHGGIKGFSKQEWTIVTSSSNSVVLEYISKDGEEHFPGTVQATVSYTLTEDNELIIDMKATTDAPTPINLAGHTYFNLAGHDSGDILDHTLHMPNADYYTPVDNVSIPTGEITPVANTAFDFVKPGHTVGERIKDVPGEAPGGYDHNFVLFNLGPDAKDKVINGMASTEPRVAVVLSDPVSGRTVEISTTAPGIQFYSGNFLDGTLEGKGGVKYVQHGGLALETQGFPNAINQDNFPSVVLRPGETYCHILKYRFYNETAS